MQAGRGLALQDHPQFDHPEVDHVPLLNVVLVVIVGTGYIAIRVVRDVTQELGHIPLVDAAAGHVGRAGVTNAVLGKVRYA